VVLNACYSDEQAEALCARVDCVVGMSGTIGDDAARNFAIGFYGGLGERESIGAAFRQGCAAISLEGFRTASDHSSRSATVSMRAGLSWDSRWAPRTLRSPTSIAEAGGADRLHGRATTPYPVRRREDVLAQLDAWLDGQGEAGWVVLTGGPAWARARSCRRGWRGAK